jgi:hypothetical protein
MHPDTGGMGHQSLGVHVELEAPIHPQLADQVEDVVPHPLRGSGVASSRTRRVRVTEVLPRVASRPV